ncbi:MAG: S41 family peptidase, partial [Gemmatimonadota bacterium]
MLLGQGIKGYYRQPSLHANTIVFVSEGDIWLVGKAGGTAQRLTTYPAEETHPAISPDGRTVAFTGRYDGVSDVYTMPIAGGTPKRHSWDAGAQVIGWTADSKIIYTTTRYSTLPSSQLLTVDPNTNQRTLAPLAQAYEGSWDGGTLFFTRNPQQWSNTKRYKGGTAQNIWRWGGGEEGSRGDGEAVCLTCDYMGTSRYARVWNGRVYFVSDRDDVMNIWSMDQNGKDLKQHTFHTDYDVRDISLHNGRIAYQQGADIHVIDVSAPVLAKAASSALNITITTDLGELRDRWVKKPIDFLTDYRIDRAGDRISLIARGMVFIAPVGQGRFIHLPNNGGVRYRGLRFAPDGKSLFTLNDRSGEVEIWREQTDGSRTQLTKDAQILRWDLEVSPDGKHIAHDDKNQKLYLYDVAAKSNKLIAQSRYGGFGYWWAPD